MSGKLGYFLQAQLAKNNPIFHLTGSSLAQN
jgi:hypothetical protein